MTSESQLDVVNGHGREESELSRLNGEAASGESVNAAYTVLNDTRKQGNGSISNTVTNAERRTFTDR